MSVICTHSFRIAKGSDTVKYTAGNVIEDDAHASWALENKYGREVKDGPSGAKAKLSPANKAADAPNNKAK